MNACREEQEKLNIWVAYLNLENMYGTAESIKAVFERGVQYCEPVKLYAQLIDIYTQSDKLEVHAHGRRRRGVTSHSVCVCAISTSIAARVWFSYMCV